jgi:hypothetical protein
VGPALVGALGYKQGFVLLTFLSALPLLINIGQNSIWKLGTFLFPRELSYHRNTNAGGGTVAANGDGAEDSDISSSPYASVLDNDEEEKRGRSSDAHSQAKQDGDVGLEGALATAESDMDTFALPLLLKILLATFFFVYVGMEIGFAGWISSYVVMSDLTSSHAKAAYATSVFFSALALGRVMAIPLAVYVSNSTMLRVQLSLTLASAVLVVVIAPMSYNLAVVSSGVMGLACSSLFPLVMTLVGDYGYTM